MKDFMTKEEALKFTELVDAVAMLHVAGTSLEGLLASKKLDDEILWSIEVAYKDVARIYENVNSKLRDELSTFEEERHDIHK